MPLWINAKINKANSLADQKKCDQALAIMDGLFPQHSFLDSYARLEYVEFTKTCTNFYPENNLAYIKKDLQLIKEAVKIQPFYTRYWIFLGNSTTFLAGQDGSTDTKNNLIKQAKFYFNKASELSPKRQEILVGQAKIAIVAGDYKSAEDYSKKCIALNPDLGDCYFYLAISNIYTKNMAEADRNIKIADSKIYNTDHQTRLTELVNAYEYILDYQNLAATFEKLIELNPNIAQYHSSLAFVYFKLGKFEEARQEAMIVLKLSPESKQNVDDFLKTLP